MRIDGKCALITGGASGIGHATCLAFAREGADIAVADMNLEGAEVTPREVRNARPLRITWLARDVPAKSSTCHRRLAWSPPPIARLMSLPSMELSA